jgi:periplasmic protein TonB
MDQRHSKSVLFAFSVSSVIRVCGSLIAALLINAFLLYVIHQLVNRSQLVLNEYEDTSIVEFVHLRPQSKLPDSDARKSKPDTPSAPEEILEPLDIKLTEYRRPKPPSLNPPNLDLEIPIELKGGPYLGNFKGELSADTDLDPGNPVFQVPPIYPIRARRAGIEGTVTVGFTITKDGLVKNAKIVKAKPRRVFDRAVLRAVRGWKFKPKVVGGEAVEWRTQKQIVFKLENS